MAGEGVEQFDSVGFGRLRLLPMVSIAVPEYIVLAGELFFTTLCMCAVVFAEPLREGRSGFCGQELYGYIRYCSEECKCMGMTIVVEE